MGFFSKKGELEKGDLGLIEVKDFMSFVAVKRSIFRTLLEKIKDEKIKGKKYKVEVARWGRNDKISQNAEQQRLPQEIKNLEVYYFSV